MARYPGANWRPVGRYAEGGSVGGAMPTCGRLILHTAVSSRSSLFDLFNTAGNPVAHFYVAADGSVEQYVDTSRRASAILEGNYDGITVETQDIGGPFPSWSGSNVPAWTDAQVEALTKLAVWCKNEHGIPLHPLYSSRPGHKGIGTHRLGIDGNFPSSGILRGRITGGEHWSESGGKVCPGDRRIAQTYEEVIPLAHRMVATPAPAKPAVQSSNVEAALREIRQSIKATKPDSPLRKALRPIAKTLRGILAKRPHEDSNGKPTGLK